MAQGDNKKREAAERKRQTREEFDKQFKAEFERQLEASKKFCPPGKNTPYSAKLKARVIVDVLEKLRTGMSLNQACEETVDAPTPAQFRFWVRADEHLSIQYAQARQTGYEAMADDLQNISDKPERGEIVTTESLYVDGKKVEGADKVTTKTEDMLGHRRLKTDTRKWLLSKTLPKIYGDKIAVQTNNDSDFAATLAAIAAKLPV